MSMELVHATILVSKHARAAKLALLLEEVDSTVLFLKSVAICLFSGHSELILIMSKLTVIPISTSSRVDPKLANLCFPFASGGIRHKIGGI